jgi:uncharacterized membrane protein HdeD (DUF308 family)
MDTYRWTHLFEALSLILLGIFAMALPHLFTIGLEKLMGITFIFSSLVQFIRIFSDRIQPRSLLYFFIAVMYFVCGIVYLIYPTAGILSMGLILIGFLMVDGVAKIVLGYQAYPFRMWVGFILNGVLSLIMALIVFKDWPETAFWVPGVFSGVNLLFYGSSLLLLALSEQRKGGTKEA